MAVYLDYNATTPLEDSVIEIMGETMKEAWANPGSAYGPGKKAAEIIEVARGHVAKMINAKPEEIIFTSGGTESNNMVIQSIFGILSKEEQPHVISSEIEHDSVLKPLKYLQEKNRIELTFLPVSLKDGSVDVSRIFELIKPNTVLISIMLANNETGIINHGLFTKNIKKYYESMMDTNFPTILIHTDASQAIGKIEVDVEKLKVDFLTLTGHKFYGPRIGALYIRNGTPFVPSLRGGGQERGLRPGTPNTPCIAGLGEAARLVHLNLNEYSQHFRKLKVYFKSKLKDMFKENVKFNCDVDLENSLPNTLNVALTFPGEPSGSEILTELSDYLYASIGATCHSCDTCGSSIKPSEILLKSHINLIQAKKSIRLSVGRETTLEDIDRVVEAFKIYQSKLLDILKS